MTAATDRDIEVRIPVVQKSTRRYQKRVSNESQSTANTMDMSSERSGGSRLSLEYGDCPGDFIAASVISSTGSSRRGGRPSFPKNPSRKCIKPARRVSEGCDQPGNNRRIISDPPTKHNNSSSSNSGSATGDRRISDPTQQTRRAIARIAAHKQLEEPIVKEPSLSKLVKPLRTSLGDTGLSTSLSACNHTRRRQSITLNNGSARSAPSSSSRRRGSSMNMSTMKDVSAASSNSTSATTMMSSSCPSRLANARRRIILNDNSNSTISSPTRNSSRGNNNNTVRRNQLGLTITCTKSPTGDNNNNTTATPTTNTKKRIPRNVTRRGHISPPPLTRMGTAEPPRLVANKTTSGKTEPLRRAMTDPVSMLQTSNNIDPLMGRRSVGSKPSRSGSGTTSSGIVSPMMSSRRRIQRRSSAPATITIDRQEFESLLKDVHCLQQRLEALQEHVVY